MLSMSRIQQWAFDCHGRGDSWFFSEIYSAAKRLCRAIDGAIAVFFFLHPVFFSLLF